MGKAMTIGNYTLTLQDLIIYFGMVFIYFFGIYFCISPLIKVDLSLKDAIRKLKKGEAEYTDPYFLRCRHIDDYWRRYIINLGEMRRNNGECHVGDFINTTNAVTLPGHNAFADILPGLLTSLGILGTFAGLVRGISGLDISTTDAMTVSIAKLLSGMSSAFYTSITGVIGAVTFQLFRRIVMSIANGTVARFTNACEMYISRPITMETELLQTIYALTAEVRATNQLLSARNKQ